MTFILIPSALQLPAEGDISLYAFNISRLDSTRSIRGRMPNSLEMARDSS